MNRDIIIILICVIIFWIGLKIYYKYFDSKDYEEFVAIKPDGYNFSDNNIIDQDPEIYKYKNTIPLVDKQQSDYSYYNVDKKIEIPNKIIIDVLDNILKNQSQDYLFTNGKTPVVVFDLETINKINFDSNLYKKEYNGLVDSFIKVLNKEFYKTTPFSEDNKKFNLLKIDLIKITEFDKEIREYILNIHVSRNEKYSGFVIQINMLMDIFTSTTQIKDLTLISRPLKISYDKIKPLDYNKDSQIVYLVEDMEKTCRDGETDESNEYCVLSKSDTGNRNNIFSYNNERLNREIMERKIIIEDNSKIKDMVEEYLKKNEKKNNITNFFIY